MSTIQIMATLLHLQQIDLEIDRLVNEQRTLESSLKDKSPVKRLKNEFELARQQLLNGLQAQKEAEWALEELEQRLTQQQQRMYSGNVANSKELQALQQEIQHLRAQQARQEEITLEMMETTEALQETVELKDLAVQRAEDTWNLSHTAGVAKREELDLKLQAKQQQRSELTVTLDSELLKRYEIMRKTKQGRVVSKIEQNSCQWCRVILTPSELQRVRINLELQTCGNCGRLLYYER